MNEVGTVIRRMREGARLTQEQLAAEVGSSRSLVGRWESGVHAPSVLRFLRICKATDTEPEIAVLWLTELMEKEEKD